VEVQYGEGHERKPILPTAPLDDSNRQPVLRKKCVFFCHSPCRRLRFARQIRQKAKKQPPIWRLLSP
jgi:hypothetical protein